MAATTDVTFHEPPCAISDPSTYTVSTWDHETGSWDVRA